MTSSFFFLFFVVFVFSCSIIFPVTHGSSGTSPCEFTLTDSHGIRADFDLSPFDLLDEVFEVDDKERPGMEYKFNICADIPSVLFYDGITIPKYCHGQNVSGPCVEPGGCASADANVYPAQAHEASAVQIDSATKKCVWLGMYGVPASYNMPSSAVSLIDSDNVGRGVKFTLLNGGWCALNARNRQLSIYLECPDVKRFEMEEATTITESVTEHDCSYQVYYESALACPSACVERLGLVFAVCSGNGICVSDPYSLSVRCLCDDDWGGAFCQEKRAMFVVKNADHSGLIAAIVICAILLLAAVIMAVVLCHKIRLRQANELSDVDKNYFQGMLDEENEAVQQKKQSTGQILLSSTNSSSTGTALTSTNNNLSLDEQVQKDTNNEIDAEEAGK